MKNISDLKSLKNAIKIAYSQDPDGMLKRVLESANVKRWERIRDFALIELNRGHSKVAIFYVPMGLWMGFSLDYDGAKERLQNPDGDDQLIQLIVSAAT